MYSFPVDSGADTPAILTIAGSDSGGGAGIQADLKTCTAMGCYGTSVVTALTAQNTKGVQAVHVVPPSFVKEQLRSVFDDINVAAIKTGMLANKDVVRTVVSALKALPSLPPLVIDPVCVSTSGHTLLEHEALEVLTAELLPLAAVVTPNTDEAALLLQQQHWQHRRAADLGGSDPPLQTQIASIEDMVRASRKLCARAGLRAVLLKGGHVANGLTLLTDIEAAIASGDLQVHSIERDGFVLPGENMDILSRAAGQDPAAVAGVHDVPVVVDVLCEKEDDRGSRDVGRCTLFVRPYLDSTSTHGTGCTLSAALACALARGESLVEAVKFSTMYTHHGIANSSPVGSGHGPLNHMHSLLPRVLPRQVTHFPLFVTVADVASLSKYKWCRPTRSDPYPLVRTLIRSNADIWKQYVQHDFVKQLGQGTLSRDRFIHFIKQDYLYLKYYARANGLLASKSRAYSDFAAAAETILAVVKEHKMHILFSAQWGIDLAELEGTPESPACTAYGAYIMDVGLQGDAASLLMALAACLLGYGEVGLWLQREANRPQTWVQIENNPYRKWIEDYSGEGYQGAVKVGIERIEGLALDDSPSPKRLAHWKEMWGRCTLLEKQFWDMAMNLS